MRPRSHVVRGFYIFWRAPRGRKNPTTSSLEVSLACYAHRLRELVDRTGDLTIATDLFARDSNGARPAH